MGGVVHRLRLRPPALHWPSIRGRARADAGPLLLAAAVVAAVALLAGAVPPLLRATADDAVRDTVRRAGDTADVRVHARFERDDGPSGGRLRAPLLADDVDDFRDRAAFELSAGLNAVLQPPVAAVTSPVLNVTDGSVLRTFQLAYLAADGGGPAVTWIAGTAPGPAAAAGADRVVVAPYVGPPWPVQVGLSEADAAALRLSPGDTIPLKDTRNVVKDVRVSGIFRPADDADPAWRLAPSVLHPVAGVDGVGTTRLGGLLSRDSLPDARLAFDQDQLERTVRFAPQPDALSWSTASALAANVVQLKATSGASSGPDGALRWESQLDAVLRDARTQVNAASAQASVLLTGIIAATVLVLLVAAGLLVHRREPTLIAARHRGAALPDLGTELFIESAAAALAATAIGLALARAVTPGVAVLSVLPLAAAAAAATAAPAFGVLAAARATNDRRTPANRSARRWTRRTHQLRRAALDVAIVAAAAGALVALHQRGIDPTPDGGAGLPTSAPALGAVAAALLLLRLLPAGTRLALRRALRSRRPLAVFGAARAAATATRLLPPLALVTATALASFALTVDATAGQGLADGAWRTVGADARVDVAPAAATSTPALAARIAAAPGIDHVVVAQVTDQARVIADTAVTAPRLVVVDTAAFRRLLAATPLPDAPDLARLADPAAGQVPALVLSGDGSLKPGMHLQLPQPDGAPAIRLTAVGAAPAIGDATDVVVVDAANLPLVPNTVWVTGPGTAAAVSGVSGDAGADVVLRADVERARRAAPLTAGLLRLARTAAATLLVLGLLGLALGAAAGAPQRWQTITRLRTLGLRPRDARWIAAGELLPAVLLAAVGGPLLGVLLARFTLGPLQLRLLTRQSGDPALALPWGWLALLSGVLLAAVAVMVPVETALRRRRQLGEVLRAGE